MAKEQRCGNREKRKPKVVKPAVLCFRSKGSLFGDERARAQALRPKR